MSDSTETHNYHQLIQIFDSCFYEEFNTRLIKGDDEPIYLPADEQEDFNRIVFAHGYYASGLHEISHWCVAGAERRKLVDFGYWYCPDGRDAQTQSEFEKVEIKPQSYEWLFCAAAGFRFNVSCDNLSGDCEPDAWLSTIRSRRSAADLATRRPRKTGALYKSVTIVLQYGTFDGGRFPCAATARMNF